MARSALSGRPDWIALIGVVVSIVLHIILDADKPFLPFIVGCCLFWVGFIVFRVSRDRTVLHEWGFRFDNLRSACLLPLSFFMLSAASLAIWGAAQGTLRFPPHLPLLLLLYPLWGFIQQFLALGIVVRSLETIPALRGNSPILAALTGLLFSLVHVNDWRVAAATGGLEFVFVFFYLRDRNVIPLAVAHGWLGAFFYLWVLNVDLWQETFM